MEKYSQFRDRGSGIAPFLPVVHHPTSYTFLLKVFLLCVRLPFLTSMCLAYYLVLQWLPLGSLVNKTWIWVILGIPGIWWIDLQIDGVPRGSLSKQDYWRLPRPGSIIASNFTSPIDPFYLAAVFDPVFTISYPLTRKVRHVTLFGAVYHAFASPQLKPPAESKLISLRALMKRYPDRTIVVFPECTTTNGKGVLRPSPSLVSAPPLTKIYPMSLRYSPADITTPIPGTYLEFLWNLLRRPTHCICVRIADHIVTPAKSTHTSPELEESYGKLFKDLIQENKEARNDEDDDDDDAKEDVSITTQDELDKSLTEEQHMLLREVGKALARLGRVKRVGLGVVEKKGFAELWASQKTGMAKKLS